MERIPKINPVYPPYLYLAQVAEHCPKAISTYLALWRTANKECKVRVYKDEVRTEFLISLSKFRHDLLLLVKEALVSVEETKKVINIELVGWDEDGDLCA